MKKMIGYIAESELEDGDLKIAYPNPFDAASSDNQNLDDVYMEVELSGNVRLEQTYGCTVASGCRMKTLFRMSFAELFHKGYRRLADYTSIEAFTDEFDEILKQTPTNPFTLETGASNANIHLGSGCVSAKISGRCSKIADCSFNARLEVHGDNSVLLMKSRHTKAYIYGHSCRICSLLGYASIQTANANAAMGVYGNFNDVKSMGDFARINLNGGHNAIHSYGSSAHICADGDGTKIISTGVYSKLYSMGRGANIIVSGKYTDTLSEGVGASIISSGIYSRIRVSGDHSTVITSNVSAKVECIGDGCSVSCFGFGSRVKASLGTWITLTEKPKDREHPDIINVKSKRVDGEILKADTWYYLNDGKFTEILN